MRSIHFIADGDRIPGCKPTPRINRYIFACQLIDETAGSNLAGTGGDYEWNCSNCWNQGSEAE
jgi:hypothetical protein